MIVAGKTTSLPPETARVRLFSSNFDPAFFSEMLSMLAFFAIPSTHNSCDGKIERFYECFLSLYFLSLFSLFLLYALLDALES